MSGQKPTELLLKRSEWPRLDLDQYAVGSNGIDPEALKGDLEPAPSRRAISFLELAMQAGLHGLRSPIIFLGAFQGVSGSNDGIIRRLPPRCSVRTICKYLAPACHLSRHGRAGFQETSGQDSLPARNGFRSTPTGSMVNPRRRMFVLWGSASCPYRPPSVRTQIVIRSARSCTT